jgi:hypothetical protein
MNSNISLAHIIVELSYIERDMSKSMIDSIIEMWKNNGFIIILLDYDSPHRLILECRKNVDNKIEIVKDEMKNMYDLIFDIPDSVKVNNISTSIQVG